MNKAVIGIFVAWVLFLNVPAIGVQQVSFDRLYPESVFGQAREHCIRAWGSLDEFLYASQRDGRFNLLLDAALGQLTFAKSCVKKIDGQKGHLSNQDLIDFSRVIGTVTDRSERLGDGDSREKIALIKHVIARLRKCCEKILIQSNQS